MHLIWYRCMSEWFMEILFVAKSSILHRPLMEGISVAFHGFQALLKERDDCTTQKLVGKWISSNKNILTLLYASDWHLIGKPNEVPLTWYNVNQGETVRFRVIAVGIIYPLRISVDQHYLTIVASDGYDVENTIVESFIINPGERFDFLLTANQSVGNYWFRAVSREVSMM